MKEVVVKAMDEPKKEMKKEQPKIILPKQHINLSQKKIEVNNVNANEMRRLSEQNLGKKESKNEFMANLQRMMEDNGKNKKVIKQGPSYAEIQGKNV